MLKRQITLLLQTVLLVLTVLPGTAGCSKKNDQAAAAAAAPVNTDTPTAPTAPVTAATVAIVPSTNIKQSFADMDAAMKNKAYLRAVQSMLEVQQQKQLTDQEAMEAHNRMVGLQSSLAASIANGDENARAAAELLRQSVLR